MFKSYLKSFPLLLDLLEVPPKPPPKLSPKKSSKISEKDDEKSKLLKPWLPHQHLEKLHVQIDHN